MKIQITIAVCVAIALSACNKKSNAPPGSPVKPYEPKSLAKPDLFVARMDGKYGYIDKTGLMVLPPRYVKALEFSDGLAAVLQAFGRSVRDAAARSIDDAPSSRRMAAAFP